MKKLLNSKLLYSALFFVMTITIFGPLELYFTNSTEFWFTFQDTLKISSILAIPAIFITLFIGIILRGKAQDFYTAALFILSIVFLPITFFGAL